MTAAGKRPALMRQRLSTSIRRLIHFLIEAAKPDRLSFRDIIGKVRRDDYSREEGEALEHIAREVVIPAAKWLFIGVILTVLVLWAQDLIGEAIIILSLYLIVGLYRFERENELRQKDMKKEISAQRIFFSTDMERRIRTQCLLIAAVAAISMITSAFILYHNGRLEILTGKVIRFWGSSTPEAQLDFIAVLVFLFTSVFVVSVGIFRVAQLSNVIITEKGIHISDSFLSWSELKEAETEYFFRRPVHLTLKTFGGSVIKIQLSRLKIGDSKAEEITHLVNQLIAAEKSASTSNQQAL